MSKTDVLEISEKGFTIVPLNLDKSKVQAVGSTTQSKNIMQIISEEYGFSYRHHLDFPNAITIFGKEITPPYGRELLHFEVNTHYRDLDAPILLHIDVSTDSVLLYSESRNEFALRKMYHVHNKDDMFFWYGKVKYFGSEFMEHSRYV